MADMITNLAATLEEEYGLGPIERKPNGLFMMGNLEEPYVFIIPGEHEVLGGFMVTVIYSPECVKAMGQKWDPETCIYSMACFSAAEIHQFIMEC